jgi:hypothetical protein
MCSFGESLHVKWISFYPFLLLMLCSILVCDKSGKQKLAKKLLCAKENQKTIWLLLNASFIEFWTNKLPPPQRVNVNQNVTDAGLHNTALSTAKLMCTTELPLHRHHYEQPLLAKEYLTNEAQHGVYDYWANIHTEKWRCYLSDNL